VTTSDPSSISGETQGAMKYGLLRQRNPAYTAARWEELGDLYVGGYPLLDKTSWYMPRFVGETPDRYSERLAAASYVNHIGQIADYFVANLFSQDIVVTPASDADDPTTAGSVPRNDGFYGAFAHDADLCGTSFAKLLRQVFTTALIKGKALVAADLPLPNDVPVSLAEETVNGAGRGYAFEVPVEQLIDWEYDQPGRFAWAILQRILFRRATPDDTRGLITEEFKIWTMGGGFAQWELFRTAPHTPNARIGDDVEVPRVGGGATTFRQIPILELTMPAGLWVGNKLGCLAREHFQRRSALNAAENKSLFAIPFIKLGPEVSAPGDAMPSEVQQNPRRGRDPRGEFNRRGYVVLGKDDEIGFAEPAGTAYGLVEGQLEKLVDEMFRVVHQMAASVSATTTALGRAAASKAEDRGATEVVLGAYGSLVRDFAKSVHDCLSAARDENVVWTPHGLDKFELEGRDAILKEALAVDAISIPSTTFRKLYKTKLAFALVGNVPPETKAVIQQEIEKGVAAEGDRPARAEDPGKGDRSGGGAAASAVDVGLPAVPENVSNHPSLTSLNGEAHGT
jgi:hypothetical protein